MLEDGLGSTGEAQRLAAVRRYAIEDTAPEGALDRITALAARRLRVPVSFISIVDERRILFKAKHGLALQGVDAGQGLSASTVRSDEPLILMDARADPASRSNPLVAELGLRFYAGVPLRTPDGYNLGALCAMARDVPAVDLSELEDLRDLADLVIDLLELRLANRRAAARSNLMVKEVDHRVMNSLQFVSGLLARQSRVGDMGSAASHLRVAAGRVAAVAQVHRQFAADVSSAPSCKAFLRRLCSDLEIVLGRRIEVTGAEGAVPSSWIQPIGLLVNECVTNAAKHGAGLIEIALEEGPDAYILTVADRGDGLPEGFDLRSGEGGLGMPVIRSLVGQLGGVLAATNRIGGGAVFEVTLPRS